MATPKKTQLNIVDHNHGIVQKLWMVGQPLENNLCLNYIGHANDPSNHNEERTCGAYQPPKYFTDFAAARACAKFWNEKVPWKYDETQLVRRHGMLCAFKPHLVKVVMA